MTTILYHPASRLHNPTYSHPDNPARIDALLEGIRPHVTRHPSRQATVEELCRTHTAEYVSRILDQRGKCGSAGPGAPLTEHSVDAALWSAGAAIEAAGVAMSGGTSLALCRPAGHHARPHTGMGFCVFNNVAVAAFSCIESGLSRVFVLDWDVHHGNGTQEIFYGDDKVFFCSLHQRTAYPKSGSKDEVGSGKGTGYTLNIPFEEGCGDSEYLRCVERTVIPAIKDFDPQVILISAGFDGHINDPLAKMNVSASAYGLMTQTVWEVAKGANVGLALILEGGYSIHNLGDCISCCLDQLS